MRRSEILGLEGAAVKQKELRYCPLFVHKWCKNKRRKSLSNTAWTTKPFGRVHESVSDTKVDSQRYHMELLNEKITKSTSFEERNLVHSIRIVACNERYPYILCYTKLWITGPCYAQKMSYLTVGNIVLCI